MPGSWLQLPSSVLSGLQRLHERRAFDGRGAGVGQPVELHRSFFRRGGLRREQPAFGAGEPLLEFLAAAGNGVEPDRAQGHRRRGERTVLFGRSVAGRSPGAVGELVDRQVVNMRVGQRIGRIAGGRHAHQRVAERVRAAANRRAQAHGLEKRHVGRHGETQFLLGLLLVDSESLLARQGDGHRRRANCCGRTRSRGS